MQLHDIHQGVHRRKLRKRVGRGPGSGHGKTSSKGHKGHSSRQGYKISPIMEGGQMRLALRIPKRGFSNAQFETDYATVNLKMIESRFEAGATVDEAALRKAGVVKGRHDDGLKILGGGEITKGLTVKAQKFTESARAKILAAGGQVVVVDPPRRKPKVAEAGQAAP
jgi:large subunit ribosomal protein L15